MSDITDDILKGIKSLDPGRFYKERICMWRVSKDWRGEFRVGDRDRQECQKPGCVTLKAHVRFESKLRGHRPCDSVVSADLDGQIEGEIVFSHIEDGQRRGCHVGRIEWQGQNSRLVGSMSGTTNAGTHRRPLMDCERCEEPGHMEGFMEAVVVEGERKGCRVCATYMIEFDASVGWQDTAFRGAIEGVLICDCQG